MRDGGESGGGEWGRAYRWMHIHLIPTDPQQGSEGSNLVVEAGVMPLSIFAAPFRPTNLHTKGFLRKGFPMPEFGFHSSRYGTAAGHGECRGFGAAN
jgi:hypothetical protein